MKNCYKALRYLDNSESVKTFVAKLECSPSWKKNLCQMYSYYASLKGIDFKKPKYQAIEKLPEIPLGEHINYIIFCSSKKYASAFSIIRDTGIRPIECARIKVKDIDFTKKTITISSAKGGKGRIVKLKDDTIARLKEYIGRKQLTLNDKLYPSSEAMGIMWRRQI